jgi:hypothetical protein
MSDEVIMAFVQYSGGARALPLLLMHDELD